MKWLFNNKENTSNKKTTITNSNTDYPTTKAIINAVWPVGSIYMSVNSTNPSAYLPGTSWTAWRSGRVPVGVDASQTEFNKAEKTGGEKTHTLTINEMPSHKHSVGDSGHSHSFSVPKSQTDIPNGVHHKGVRDYGDFTTESAKANITESTVGSNYTHNNLQPYITCDMFKRIA